MGEGERPLRAAKELTNLSASSVMSKAAALTFVFGVGGFWGHTLADEQEPTSKRPDSLQTQVRRFAASLARAGSGTRTGSGARTGSDGAHDEHPDDEQTDRGSAGPRSADAPEEELSDNSEELELEALSETDGVSAAQILLALERAYQAGKAAGQSAEPDAGAAFEGEDTELRADAAADADVLRVSDARGKNSLSSLEEASDLGDEEAPSEDSAEPVFVVSQPGYFPTAYAGAQVPSDGSQNAAAPSEATQTTYQNGSFSYVAASSQRSGGTFVAYSSGASYSTSSGYSNTNGSGTTTYVGFQAPGVGNSTTGYSTQGWNSTDVITSGTSADPASPADASTSQSAQESQSQPPSSAQQSKNSKAWRTNPWAHTDMSHHNNPFGSIYSFGR